MKILKISDGFVTNSSSDNMVIVLAIRKGKNLNIELSKVCIRLKIPVYYIPDFYEGLERLEGLEYEGEYEIDHLMDEYDFYYSKPETYINEGDDYYQMSREKFRRLVKLFESIKNDESDDLILLHFCKSVVVGNSISEYDFPEKAE